MKCRGITRGITQGIERRITRRTVFHSSQARENHELAPLRSSRLGAADYATHDTHCHVEKTVKPPILKGVNLLVIEDDVDLADVLARPVREEGHVTTVADSGEAGLASLARQRPYAVLLSEIAKARDLGVTEVIEKSYVLRNFSESLGRATNRRPSG